MRVYGVQNESQRGWKNRRAWVRERQRDSVSMGERETERQCVYARERETERQCVYARVRETE